MHAYGHPEYGPTFRDYRAAAIITPSGARFTYVNSIGPADPLNHANRLRYAQHNREYRRLHIAAAALARGGR